MDTCMFVCNVIPGMWSARAAVLQVVGALMHEIECILHEYLSFNWDRVDEVYEANALYLCDTGLKCLWKSSTNLQVLSLQYLVCQNVIVVFGGI